MLCATCGEDKHPLVEGDQRGRFVYTCANASCHATLGPVKPANAIPAVVANAPAVAQPAAVLAPALVSTPVPAVAITSGDHLEQMRARLVAVDAALASHEPLLNERTFLRRMIAAAERTPKKRATRAPSSNVIPIAKVST